MSRVYCSDAARLRGDDNAATAARIDVWILVELPITWGRDPITEAALPQTVRNALKRASHDIPRSRVVFIRKRVECLGATRVYVIRSAPHTGVTQLDLDTLEDVATVPFVSIANDTASSAARPLVLVCTHGQHDSCCGRRGYPLFDALRQHDGIDLWQCSHIGGDRFAANAVVLPWGLYYGPVEPRDAGALVDSLARDEIFLPAYRGRCSMPKPLQAAETFVRRETNILARDAFELLSREKLEHGRMQVRLKDTSGAIHDVTIERSDSAETAMLTCTASTAANVSQFRMIDYKRI
ncbi:MAG TPA: sucrase ferredoxin [Thermoanaerobaculia bacterium]|nr:sucrase ferredoxin [Thermoanaerobaculia bacterium]